MQITAAKLDRLHYLVAFGCSVLTILIVLTSADEAFFHTLSSFLFLIWMNLGYWLLYFISKRTTREKWKVIFLTLQVLTSGYSLYHYISIQLHPQDSLDGLIYFMMPAAQISVVVPAGICCWATHLYIKKHTTKLQPQPHK
jgi:hypothetical protein